MNLNCPFPIVSSHFLIFQKINELVQVRMPENLPIPVIKMSDSGVYVSDSEEGSDQVAKKLKLDPDNVLPLLRCAKCQDFFRGQVFDCLNNHTTCTLCCGVDIKSSVDKAAYVVCPMENCKAKSSDVGKNLTQMVRDLRLKVPCKNRDAGCSHEGIEDELEKHEDECGQRKIKCDYGCGKFPFKDLLNHYKDAHARDCNESNNKKWLMCNEFKLTGKDESIGYKEAYRYEIGPDGLVFLTDVIQHPTEAFFVMAVRVMAGKQVAKKYRAELRVSSNESPVSFSYCGPVYPIEYLKDAITTKERFEIGCSKLALFNHGKEYFGVHNKDKNGELVLPISVKIEKKELGFPSD